MNVTTVTDGIFRLSANVEDLLFEGLWPIPNGVSMNSYIVKGEKTAIVASAKGHYRGNPCYVVTDRILRSGSAMNWDSRS